MTKEEVINIAHVVGVVDFLYSNPDLQDAYEFLQRFAVTVEALASTKEREACAKVCDDVDVEYEGEDVLATWCSQAIRARSKQ